MALNAERFFAALTFQMKGIGTGENRGERERKTLLLREEREKGEKVIERKGKKLHKVLGKEGE